MNFIKNSNVLSTQTTIFIAMGSNVSPKHTGELFSLHRFAGRCFNHDTGVCVCTRDYVAKDCFSGNRKKTDTLDLRNIKSSWYGRKSTSALSHFMHHNLISVQLLSSFFGSTYSWELFLFNLYFSSSSINDDYKSRLFPGPPIAKVTPSPSHARLTVEMLRCFCMGYQAK